jgi:anti-sigma factor ChrR (cupin superfamily)
MITEQQEELATRCALDDLSAAERADFSAQLRVNRELREFLRSVQAALEGVARAVPQVNPPPALKQKILERLRSQAVAGQVEVPVGLRFLAGSETGWKSLPIPGAYIKLLSLQADRGYAVLLGKLEPGVRYPAHTNAGPEDFYILTGDLHVGSQALGPGDFHHADAGSQHTENYSVAGCTLLAVLTTDDPLVQLAMA